MVTKITKNLRFLSLLGLILMGVSFAPSAAEACQCICWVKTFGLDYEQPEKYICEDSNKDYVTCEECCKGKEGHLLNRTQCE